jgi:hypothetical protein
MNLKRLLIPAAFVVLPLQGALAQTDYEKDKTKTYVHERASEALEQVNSILCMFDQTRYADSTLLNSGYYTALVDESLCGERDSAEKSNSSSSGDTSANGAASYTEFKIKSERTNPTDPQVVSAFVKVNGPNGMPMNIQAKLTITEGASEFNPIGAFTMAFKGSVNGIPVPITKGIVKAQRDTQGRVVLKYAESMSFGGQELFGVKAALLKNTEGGSGSTFQKEIADGQGPGGGATQSTTHFGYDKTNFKRKDASTNEETCLSRTTFETSAWQYGLYNKDTGERIAVNSGFPINTQADGRGQFGFLSFHGLFFPPGGPNMTDGSTVYRLERGANGPVSTPYTLTIKDGKLKRFVRSEVTLGSLKNIPLEGMVPFFGDSNPSSIKRFQWDGSQLKVVATATMSQNGPPSWTPVSPNQPITNQTTLMFGDIGIYSQALGGQGRIKLSNCVPVSGGNPASGVRCSAPSADTKVIFFRESLVAPGDSTVPATLRCYDSCPKAGPSGMDKNDPTYANDGTAHNYAFTTGILRDGGNPATLSEAQSGRSWGFGSGPLFEPSSANLAALACPWDANQVCAWKAWGELSEFFMWETGPNSWNKFTSVVDGNSNIVTLDPPLAVQFVYPAAGTGGVNPTAVDQKFAGNTFYLQYGGFGSLQGIPGKCFNPANPSDTDIDCSKPGRRWVPEFTIPAGSVAKNGNGVDAFYVKPLEVEQRMAKVAATNCSSIKVSDLSGTWPNLDTDWTDPNLGTEPEVSGAPKVVAGVLQ